MKKIITFVFLLLVLIIIFPIDIFAQEIASEIKEGRVIKILETGKKTFLDEMVDFQVLEIEVTKGEKRGEIIEIENSAAGLGLVDVKYQKYNSDDLLKITTQRDMEGKIQYVLDGQVKRGGILTLTFIFLVVVLVVGRVWGALSLVGLFTSFIVIFKLIMPLIIQGIDPVLAAILGSLVIIPITFYISHGFNTKTHIAIVATFIGLIIIGLLAVHFINVTHLTGFASEEAGFLQVEKQGSINIRGLLLAGIIIGTLGILDDITIGQASTVKQLKEANPKMNWLELFKKGMIVGQDHISSMVNTLILVYSGSALPLLLLFFDSQKTFGDVLEFELIAEEIVRMLVGSIGLVLSAPIATILAAYFFSRKKEFAT